MDALNQFFPKFKGSLIPLTIMLSFGLILFACNETQNPVSESTLTQSFSSPAALTVGVNEDPVTIQDFTIKFNGNSYDEEADKSTFSYTVTRLSSASGFNYMAFEIPECAADDLAGYSPSTSNVTDEEIRWTSSIGSGSSRVHTVTYHGKKTTGMIDATIQGTGSGNIETKVIPGPCKGIYSISGFVYVDENGDGSRSIGEAGIGNVTVSVTDTKNNSTGSVVTSPDGSYTFKVYTGGIERTFNLEVPDETPENSSDINELLSSTYIASEIPLELPVVLSNENISGKNFGFTPDTDGIIEKFENPEAVGAIILKTKEPEYWERELFFSTRGRKTDFNKEQLLEWLEEIENLDLTFNFNFGSDKIAAAKDILSVRLKGGNQSSALDILKSELLAAKLNVVSGNGAVDGPDFNADQFNLLILKTGAAAVVKADPDLTGPLMMNSAANFQTTSITTSSLVTEDGGTSKLLTSFNRSGTGGGGVGTQ